MLKESNQHASSLNRFSSDVEKLCNSPNTSGNQQVEPVLPDHSKKDVQIVDTASLSFTSRDLLISAYTAAYAPLSSDTIIDEIEHLAPADFTVSLASEELQFFNGTTISGMKLILDAFGNINTKKIDEESVCIAGGNNAVISNKNEYGGHTEESNLNQTPDNLSESVEASVALLAASAFLKRIANHAGRLSQICTQACEQLNKDVDTVVQSLEHQIVKNNVRPADTDGLLRPYFDLAHNCKWPSFEIPSRSRVGFKETTAIISGGKVMEEALKMSDAKRKKTRNPTGFLRFSFKNEVAMDSDVNSDVVPTRADSCRGASTDGSTRGTASCTTTIGNSYSTEDDDDDEEEEESDDGEYADVEELAIVEDGRPDHVQPHDSSTRNVVFPARARIDVAEHSPRRKEMNCGGNIDVTCSKEAADSMLLHHGVAFSEREVIQDTEADPEWEAQTRHRQRFYRIRHRVPTGHPSLMKGSSDDLGNLVDEFERQVSSLQLEENTTANRTAWIAPEGTTFKPPQKRLPHDTRSVTICKSVDRGSDVSDEEDQDKPDRKSVVDNSNYYKQE